MKRSEHIFNLAAGTSVLSWALLGFEQAYANGTLSLVRLCICSVNLFVGLLFICRRPVRRSPAFEQIAVVLLSFLACGVAFVIAPPPNQWSTVSVSLFAAGTLITLTSLLYLGRSFAVFPAVRSVIDSGPYRLIRHPAYAGELLMIAGCCLAAVSWVSLSVLCLNIVMMVCRIQAEEGLLIGEESYRQYSSLVRWHLIPGVW